MKLIIATLAVACLITAWGMAAIIADAMGSGAMATCLTHHSITTCYQELRP